MGAIVAVVLNLAFWLCMYAVQNWEAKTGRIPSRRPHNQKRPQDGFRYIQDYHTTSWGDLIALSLIDIIIGAKMQAGIPAWWLVAVCLGVGLGIGLYQAMGLYHRPDWAYPWKSRLSWGGRIHVVYFSLQVAVVLAALWFLVSGSLTLPQALVGFAGGLLYLIVLFLDSKSKRLARTLPWHR